MTKLIAAIVALALSAAAAHAETRAGAPAKFPIPFASSAGSSFITYPTPTASQIGVKCGAASLTDGFPPLTMQAVSGGGCPPLGQDFNGIIKQITQWNQQTQAGAVPVWDSAFSAAIGGYPEGSILSQAASASCFWVSQVDNNTTDPDTGGSGWTGNCPGGGIGGTSSGPANAQIIAATPFALQGGAKICWTAGFGLTNTGALQINVNSSGLINVYQRTTAGLAALSGKEVQAGMVSCATYDGTQWELDTNAAAASLVNQDQILFGGANVSSGNLGTGSGGGTVTIDCGKSPLQYIINAGSFTFAAPASDGSCMVLVTNNNAAGTISFSGFTTSANTGEAFTTNSGFKFTVTFWRINGTSSYLIKSLQ